MLLTKSNYLLGLQCPKLLWVAKNDKQRIPEPDVAAKHKFKAGDVIGVMATTLFPGGVDLSELGFKENIDKTKEAVMKRETIYEAGFMVDDLFSRADVLLPVGEEEWDIIEVKSGASVKDVNIHDVSFQRYVYEKAGLKIRNCYLMHINNQYVKDGDIETAELFVQADITDRVLEFSGGIEERIAEMFEVINAKDEPKCKIDIHCSQPYDCSLMDECWKDVPDGSVFEFFRMFKSKCFDLHGNGILCLNEVPEEVKLNDKQKIQRRLAFEGGKHVDKPAIKNFLDGLKYPIYYLDFETINPAIPKFDGMKPYQRIPFQFSLHIQKEEGGECEHISFLADGVSDPRPKFLQALRDNLGDSGSVLVYNQSFEKGVMNESSSALSEFGDWYNDNIFHRIKDLWDVFKDFAYYDPKQKGSTSIKYVLPTLSDLKYSDLEISEGNLASLEYERVTYGEPKDILGEEKIGELSEARVEEEVERERVREALEKYCELDTWAEVEIVGALRETIE